MGVDDTHFIYSIKKYVGMWEESFHISTYPVENKGEMSRLIYTRNFTSGYNRCMRLLEDIAGHPQQGLIEKRVKIIRFFDKYGAEAAREAFGYSRSTVYSWKKKLKESGGKLSALAMGCRAPKKRRIRKVNALIKEFVISYRYQHPGVGKETIKPVLDGYCRERNIESISESTIGRLIRDLKDKGRLYDEKIKVRIHGGSGRLLVRKARSGYQKKRRKGYKPKAPGDLLQVDSIEIFLDGIRRYLICAVDLVGRFSFALAFRNLNSKNARIFLKKLKRVAPFKMKRIQTDNGSEFEKHFRNYIRGTPIIHYHNYPKRPQSNSFVERFNRTIQEQFVQWHEEDLFYDIEQFNKDLMAYLIWYNTEKRHRGINKLSPMQYYVKRLMKNNQKSSMLWTLISC